MIDDGPAARAAVGAGGRDQAHDREPTEPDRRDAELARQPDEEDLEEVYFEDPLESPPPEPTAARPFDPEPQRERMRGRLAAGLVVLLALLTCGGLLAMSLGVDSADVRSILEVVVPPVAALSGSAVGFYFATARNQGR